MRAFVYFYYHQATFKHNIHTNAGMASQFPFLSLPKELRFCVYEKIEVSRAQKSVRFGSKTLDSLVERGRQYGGLVIYNGIQQPANREADAIIYTLSAPVGILATCRMVNGEVYYNGPLFCNGR